MILFSGSSNPLLAKEVSDILGSPLGRAEVTRFIDNECRVRIIDEVQGKDVFVLQSLSSIADQHLVELCLFATALKNLGAKKITAVIPWMGYSKQDKAFRKGEAVSAQLVAKFIEAAGFDEVITVELHSEIVKEYFQIPVRELSTSKLLVDTLQKNSKLSFELKRDNFVIVSPDKGGQSRSEKFAKEAKLHIVYLDKMRDKETGKVTILNISGDIEGRDIIIFDDIVNTGETAIETSVFLKSKGAKSVIFLATHAVFAGSAAKLLMESSIDEIAVTNTIDIPKEKMFNSLRVVTVSPLLADAILRNIR